VLVFVEETGDTGLKLNIGSRRYFNVTIVILGVP